MKKQLTALSALTLLTTLACQGTQNIDVKANALIGVLTCVGANPKCDQNQTTGSINAVTASGALFNPDIKTTNFVDLGSVSGEKTEKLLLPSTTGAQSFYKFTTTDGKIVHLGFVVSPKATPGTRGYNTGLKLTGVKDFNIVELFRFSPEQNDWLRQDVIFVPTALASQPLDVKLNPAGDASAIGS